MTCPNCCKEELRQMSQTTKPDIADEDIMLVLFTVSCDNCKRTWRRITAWEFTQYIPLETYIQVESKE